MERIFRRNSVYHGKHTSLLPRHKALGGKNGRTFDKLQRASLWICLSLYACFAAPDLFEYLNGLSFTGGPAITSPTIESVVRPTDLSHRALSEDAPSLGKPPLHKSVFFDPRRNVSGKVYFDKEGELDVRIYVYDLPAKYNTEWLNNSRCSNHLFASEVAIHRVLMNSSVRVYDPWQADYFFVPVYVSCNFSTKNGFPSIGHARTLLGSAVELISQEMPFWNRSGGSDHVFVASHDFGACFHAMEDVAVADGIPDFMSKSIVLQTFGVKGKHRCQDVDNIQIPPYIQPDSINELWPSASVRQNRDIFAFFRGKMEIHPKNISGRVYSKGVRTTIWQKYAHNKKFYIKRKRYEGYQKEMLRSVFCLCPLGWAPWSPRIVESVALGCVPVIIADNIRLPYTDVVPWQSISLTVAERDVWKLSRILDGVAVTNLTRIQHTLWNDTVRQALLFTDPLHRGDATWHALRSLAHKAHRSSTSVS